MPIKKIYVNGFTIQSVWGTRWDEEKEVYLEKFGPTTGTANVKFPYSFNSGTKIISSKITATVNTTMGISSLTVNGSPMKKQITGPYAVDVTLTSNSGTLTAVFKFRTNTRDMKDTGAATHYGSATFSNVCLEVDYESAEEGDSDSPSSRLKGYSVPPQSVCIYDQDTNAIYTFDGVLKIQHNLSMDMQEEVSGDKAVNYVNNAKNEPDKVTLDVMMSDVYIGGTDLDMGGFMSADQQTIFTATKDVVIRENRNEWGRSEMFFYALHKLKEDRHKLSVITPQFVHVDMILTTVTVNQEDTTPFGWEGQIVFQHAFQKKKKKQTKTPDANDGAEKLSQSLLAALSGVKSTGIADWFSANTR